MTIKLNLTAAVCKNKSTDDDLEFNFSYMNIFLNLNNNKGFS